jgi:hypothetical protein
MNALRSALPTTGDTTISDEAIVSSTYHGSAGATVEDQPAVRLAAATGRRKPAYLDLEAPSLAVAVDVDQVIAGAPVLAARGGRGRADAEHRHRTVGTGYAGNLAAMIVAVQDGFAARAPDHCLEFGGVREMLPTRLVGERRVMDQHDAAQALLARLHEQALRLRDLRRPEIAGREKGRLGNAGRQANERERSSTAERGKDRRAAGRRLAVAGDVGAPVTKALVPRHRHIDIVITRNDRQAIRPVEALEPFGGAPEFLRQGHIHEVAGKGDVVGILRLDVGNDAGQRLGHVKMHAMTPPVAIARDALVQELSRARRRHWQMWIGEVRQREHAGPPPDVADRPIGVC